MMDGNATGKRERRRYTDKQREMLLADAESLGVMKAARKHGVPQPTISNWRRRSKAASAGMSTPPMSAESQVPSTWLTPGQEQATIRLSIDEPP